MQLVGTRLNEYKNTQNIYRITKLLQTITMQQILLNLHSYATKCVSCDFLWRDGLNDGMTMKTGMNKGN